MSKIRHHIYNTSSATSGQLLTDDLALKYFTFADQTPKLNHHNIHELARPKEIMLTGSWQTNWNILQLVYVASRLN